MTQVKEAKQGKHRSLAECITQPGEFLLSDFSKIERSQLLHVAFQALGQFKKVHGRCPKPGCAADGEAFKQACEAVNASLVCPALAPVALRRVRANGQALCGGAAAVVVCHRSLGRAPPRNAACALSLIHI